MSRISDPRQPAKSTYPLREVLLGGLLTILLHQGSRNGYNELRSQARFRENACRAFGLTALPHGDTVAAVLERLDPESLARCHQQVVQRLIRAKVFDPFRLRKTWLLVAVDGTGTMTFSERHCPHCLTQTHGTTTVYYHTVLEAKLVTRTGFALSLATEFIENERPDVPKQDCELRAFYRMAAQLKKAFPQLRLCFLLDGLYAAEPVFKICAQNHWGLIAPLKDGKIPTLTDEFETLRPLCPHNRLTTRSAKAPVVRQAFTWVNGIAYGDRELSVMECRETAGTKTTPFRWVTNLTVTPGNVWELTMEGGRLRWKIENEGFNTQKHGGDALEHVYSRNLTAQKNYYLLIQLASLIHQLMEKGPEVQALLKPGRRTLKRLWEDLRAELTHGTFDWEALDAETLRSVRLSFAPCRPG